MTLHAHAMRRIGGNLDGASLFRDARHHQLVGCEMFLFPADVEGEAVAQRGRRAVRGRPHAGEGRTLHVHLMTGNAGDRRPFRDFRFFEMPGTFDGERLDELLNTAFVEHAVTPETLRIDLLHMVVFGVVEDRRIAGAVSALLPMRIFRSVAGATRGIHANDLLFAEMLVVRIVARDVVQHAFGVILQCGDRFRGFAVTGFAGDLAVRGGCPIVLGFANLMTLDAGALRWCEFEISDAADGAADKEEHEIKKRK